MFSREELQKEKARIEIQYQDALSHADRYKRAIDGVEALLALSVEQEPVSAPAVANGRLTRRIMEVIEAIPLDANLAQPLIRERLGDDTSAKSVSTVLGNLADAGVLEIVERGAGRRATIYKRSNVAARNAA